MYTNIKERKRARYHAVQALYQRYVAKTSLKQLKLQYYQDNINRHLVEWSFFNCLLDGVEKKKIIDEKITLFSKYKIRFINPINLSILRLSVYELMEFLDIPYQIIVSEYVEHSESFSTNKGLSFINNILERIALSLRNSN